MSKQDKKKHTKKEHVNKFAADANKGKGKGDKK
jgi:hypothetical protein